MLTIEKKKKYTVEDYMLLDEGAPFQLINNQLVMSPSPLATHQYIVARISRIMLNFLEDNDLGGYAGGTVDVTFDDNNVFQPDFVYVAQERISDIVKLRLEGAPDLAIEILSPSNAKYDLRQKKATYEKYGVREYIIFDPVAKTADLFTLKDGSYYLHQKAQENELLHSIILPGFSFDLGYLYK